MIKNFICSVILIVLAGCFLNSTEITPVTNFSFSGGQYFLESKNSGFGGNLDIFYTPVINFSRITAILPIFNFVYRGTKDVQELVGGGTLTQESSDKGVTLKLVHRFDETFKGKAKIGFKIENLKETEDEKLGKGLFDSKRVLAGIEAEKIFENLQGSFGFEIYQMRYPNFSSLISEAQTVLDPETYQEISENAGKNVLDFNSISIFAELKKSLLNLRINTESKSFIDQKIVNQTGKFTSQLRKDFIFDAEAKIEKILEEKKTVYLSVSFLNYLSNQNSYDVNNFKFIPNFYSFYQIGLTPSLKLLYDKKAIISGSIDFSNRYYNDRLSQDEAGNYKQEKIYQTMLTAGINFTYKLAENSEVYLKISSNIKNVTSNMKYERNYRYNYTVFNYFTGIELSF